MAIPTINDIAGIINDPELRFTPQGTAILNFRLAFNDSKYNDQSKSWDTTKTFYVDAQVWEHAAERLAETLNKGDQVYVQGRVETQQWEKGGEKKSKPVMNVRMVRKLEKAQKQGGTQQASTWDKQPAQASASWGTGNQAEAPF
jgi:single-strand DNA-binding protein